MVTGTSVNYQWTSERTDGPAGLEGNVVVRRVGRLLILCAPRGRAAAAVPTALLPTAGAAAVAPVLDGVSLFNQSPKYSYSWFRVFVTLAVGFQLLIFFLAILFSAI
jgi:hypothetical protein